MTQSLFRNEAVEHQRERLWGEVMLTQPLPTKLFTGFVAIVLVSLVLYLIFGTYTRKETVQGYLDPEGGILQVHASQSGTITELTVREGELVEEGQVLARIRTDKVLEEGGALNTLVLDLLQRQKQQLKERISREERRRAAREVYLRSRIDGHERQIGQLQEQLGLQQTRVRVARERYQALSELRNDQLISEEEYQSRYQALLDEQQQNKQLEHSLSVERGDLESARFELESLERESRESVDELEAQIASLEQQSLQHRGDHAFSVKAPRAGRITSLQAQPGQLAEPQRPMMTILPEGEALKAELLVPSRAIGFIESGLSVRVRYDAFPHERFGIHESTVINVAETVLAPREVNAPIETRSPVYRVTANLGGQTVKAYGREMALDAGMTLEADILLDERPLYQWILRPLYSLKGTL